MTQRRFIGLSSGSSSHGVDAALVETDGIGMDLRLWPVHFIHYAYSRELRDLLLRAGSANPINPRQTTMLHRVLGEAFASAARLVAEQAKIPLTSILCAGCPGHALWQETDGRYPAAWNIGMADVLAERTGITTLSDFRARDIAAGGLGAPIHSLIDHLLFRDPRENRLLINLGGVATVTYLPNEASARHVLAFQAAPCTILLDGMMRLLTGGREHFDAGGKHAVQGCCIEPLLERWLGQPSLQKKPPKGIARHEFGEDFLNHGVRFARHLHRNLHDVLCTATHFVARAIAQAVERFIAKPAQRVLLSGGGVRNGLLWGLLEQHFAPLPVEKTDGYGIAAEARKAVACAGLAALTMDGVPASLANTTGASGARLLGQFTPGSSSNWAHCLSWMASQTTPWALAAA